MLLIEQIKADQLKARKENSRDRAALLTTLIGEAEMIGKNDGNRMTTDAEIVAIIKKFIGNADFTINAILDGDHPIGHQEMDSIRIKTLKDEKAILAVYLPKQLSEAELSIEIARIVGNLPEQSPKQMGLVMKLLKDQLDGQYDGKTASALVRQMLQSLTGA